MYVTIKLVLRSQVTRFVKSQISITKQTGSVSLWCSAATQQEQQQHAGWCDAGGRWVQPSHMGGQSHQHYLRAQTKQTRQNKTLSQQGLQHNHALGTISTGGKSKTNRLPHHSVPGVPCAAGQGQNTHSTTQHTLHGTQVQEQHHYN